MELSTLIANHPVLFHMAEDGTWPMIQEWGLLSTKALVELYDPPQAERERILSQVRRSSIILSRDGLPDLTIRDQGPLKFLDRVLDQDTSPQQFLDLLNGRVFFWPTEERLLRLLNAKRYRARRQTVLAIRTEALLAAHPEAELAALNTGSAHVPTAPMRGEATFSPVEAYPYAEWKKRRGSGGDALVEVTVPEGVPEIGSLVLSVDIWHQGAPIENLFKAL